MRPPDEKLKLAAHRNRATCLTARLSCLPVVTDTGRIRTELGYREVVTREAALARTVDDERRRPAV